MTRDSVSKIPASLKTRFASLRGIFFGCLAGILYGTNPLGALNLYADGLTPEVVLCYRFAFATLLLGATILLCRRSFKVKSRDLFILMILGVLISSSSLTYYASFKHMDAGLASTLLFLYPLQVTVIMCLFFKEKLTLKTALAVTVSIFGLGFLYHGGEDGSTLDSFGLLLIFISATTYAISLVLMNKANLQMGALKLTFYSVGFGFIYLFLFAVFFGCGAPPMPATLSQWSWGLMLGFVPTYLSFVFTAKSVKIAGSTPAAITGALEPLTAVCIGVLVFGEAMTFRLAIGIALILTAVVLISLRSR